MPVGFAQIKITEAEYRARRVALQQQVTLNNCDGVVLFDSFYILYYTGFAFIPTERPIAFVMNAAGQMALFVPRMETEHAAASVPSAKIDYYEEYPGETHPMHVLAGTLKSLGIRTRLAADGDGYPWILGYRGPALSDLTGLKIENVRGAVEDQMAIKSAGELDLIRESIRWANLAHTLLQRYTVVGATETEVSMRASNEATLALVQAIGPIYSAQSWQSDRVEVGYRGQIGRGGAIPHALANNIAFQPGDVLVTGASAPVWGYGSELERTMILGQPTESQRVMFAHMLALQETAFEAIEPGKPCSVVDTAVRAYFEKHDLMPYWKHHSGHTVGMRYHEGPYLDRGDSTEIKQGMVFTVEPGLYVPELGGFRHSDTVVVTGTGIEVMTYYPRDLQSLTLPV